MSNYAINQTNPSSNDGGLIFINHITYALYLFSFFTVGLTWLIAIIINYVKRGDAQGTWLESHFDWQINTFWYLIIMGIIATIFIFLGLPAGFAALTVDSAESSFSLFSLSGLLIFAGALLWFFLFFWHLYRIIRGWVALASNKSVP
jgi:uncharacterized membrane protein